MKRNLLLTTVFTTVVVVPIICRADDSCPTLPTCEELGFVYTASQCTGLEKLPCPFESTPTHYFCQPCEEKYKYTCNGGTGLGGVCNSKYSACACDAPRVFNRNSGSCVCSGYTCEADIATVGGLFGTECEGKYTECVCRDNFTWVAKAGVCAAASCSDAGLSDEQGSCDEQDGISISVIDSSESNGVSSAVCYPSSCDQYHGGGSGSSSNFDDCNSPQGYNCQFNGQTSACECWKASDAGKSDFIKLFDSKRSRDVLIASISHESAQKVFDKYVANLDAQDETDCTVYI